MVRELPDPAAPEQPQCGEVEGADGGEQPRIDAEDEGHGAAAHARHDVRAAHQEAAADGGGDGAQPAGAAPHPAQPLAHAW